MFSFALPLKVKQRSCLISFLQYRAADSPWFSLGHGIVLAYICIGWISTLALGLLLRAENARRARGERDEVIDSDSDGEGMNVFRSIDEARSEKGDWWSGFRYTL